MKNLIIAFALTCFTLFMGLANAADRLELDEANIQGASELPKVLYIVPWNFVQLLQSIGCHSRSS